MALLLSLSMYPMHVSLQSVLSLEPACALLARLFIHMSANVWLDFQMLTLDVCLKGFFFSECLITRRVFGAVVLGLVDIPVPL